MIKGPAEPRLRLPKTLSVSLLRVAIAGTFACGGAVAERSDAAAFDATHEEDETADAAPDVADEMQEDVTEQADADASPCDGPARIACLQAGSSANTCNVYVCDLSQCPPGCEPYT